MDPRSQDNAGSVNAEALARKGILCASVSAAAAVTNCNAPVAFTAAKDTSVYTVTHNLGLTANAYIVLVTVVGASAGAAEVTTKGANSVVITTNDLATPSVGDRAFDLVILPAEGESTDNTA